MDQQKAVAILNLTFCTHISVEISPLKQIVILDDSYLDRARYRLQSSVPAPKSRLPMISHVLSPDMEAMEALHESWNQVRKLPSVAAMAVGGKADAAHRQQSNRFPGQ
ncbi:hypothetical protein E4U55_003231 [Claviceps digitariae]|nr:hypothetical protein E4U55_003231 [Claviceps digitariae]